MNKFLQIYKKIITLFLSYLATISIFINLTNKNNLPLKGYDFVYIIIFILIMFLLKKAFTIKNKKIIISSIILAILFSTFETLGLALNSFNNFDILSYSIINTLIKYIGYIILFYISLINLFDFILKKEIPIKMTSIFDGSKKSFVIILSLMIIVRCLYLIIYYPGIISVDSTHQLQIVMGDALWTNHHPVFHTFLIKIFITMGQLFNSITLGILLHSLFQIIITSLIFTYTINFINKNNFPKIIRIISFIFFSFFPINLSYSITMWKDILFSCLILILTIKIYQIIQDKQYLKNKKNVIYLTLICILLFLLRNNGIYILVLSFIAFIIFIKENRKVILLIFLIIIGSYGIYKGPVFKLFNIEDGSIAEALSVPMQQLARVSYEKHSILTNKEKEFLNNTFKVNDIYNYYNPRLSDQVKNQFNTEYFENNKLEFIANWLKLFVKYPKTYTASFLNNNFGYWYPQVDYWTVIRENWENDYVTQSPNMKELRSALRTANIHNSRDIPIYSLFISIGFNFWLILISVAVLIIKKQSKYILVIVPIFALYLTVIASPVYAEYRYIYGMIISIPFIIGYTLKLENKEKEDKL